ncbi:MAG: hypothetical protein H6739_13260 [Alphaproteobacteria bacterium]|nr:hypothetical protein [Alphaproteobacteria bacterium]
MNHRPLLVSLSLLLAAPAAAGVLDKAKEAVGLEAAEPEAALPTPVYWINPAETLIFRDQLFYSAFANHLAKGQQVQVRLEGPGAPAGPLVDYVVPKDDASFQERWLSFSSGDLGTNKQGLPIEGLQAGAYTLRLLVDGDAVATHAFSLIEVPTVLGASQLQVDPRDRAWRPYVTGPYVLMWVPVDLTTGIDAYRALWWVDGQYVVDTMDAPEVPRLHLVSGTLADEPLFQLAPVVLRKQQEVGALDVALTLNEQQVLGAAHWVNTWNPKVAEGLTPVIYPPSGNPLGMLTLTAPSPDQADKLAAVTADVATRKRDPDFKAPRPLTEPQVCALQGSDEARLTYRNLLSLREEYGDAVWSTWNALQVKQDPRATDAEKKLAQEAMNRGAGKQAAYGAKVQELAARFDKQAAAYKEGCMGAFMPEGYARIQDAPRR